MKLENAIKAKLKERGLEDRVCDLVVSFRSIQLLSWLAHDVYVAAANKERLSSLKRLAEEVGVTQGCTQYAYYKLNRVPFESLRAEHGKEFDIVYTSLVESYGNAELWRELLEFAYDTLRQLAVCAVMDRSYKATDKINALGLSSSTLYKIRKNYKKINKEYEKKTDSEC